MYSTKEKSILEWLDKHPGSTVQELTHSTNTEEKEVWKIVTQLLKTQQIQTVYRDNAFVFYKAPLTQCPYCGRLFATEAEVKTHIWDHLADLR